MKPTLQKLRTGICALILPGRAKRTKLFAIVLIALVPGSANLNAQCSSASYTISTSSNCAEDYVSNVTFAGINHNSACDGNVLFASPTTTVVQGQSYSISVSTDEYPEGVRAWIDYNNDGQFNNTTELVLGPLFAGTAPATYTGMITIPVTSIVGSTRLRVRCNYNGAPADAQASQSWGETEDYCITIDPQPLCTGTPNTPTLSVPAGAGCPNVPFTINQNLGALTGGTTFSWQSSSSATGPFTNIPGANSQNLTTSITAVTYFRSVVECTNSAQTVTSSVVSVGSPGQCVCATYPASSANFASDGEILRVQLSNLDNISNCATPAGGAGSIQNRYSNYAGVVAAATLCPNSTNAFTVQAGTCGGNYGTAIKVYIDFNQNGVFTDAGEQVYVSPATANTPYNVTANLTVPANALPGLTRMRVIMMETGSPSSIVSNATYGYGETEDYCVYINTLPTITVSQNTGSVCPGGTQTLTASGGISYTVNGGSGTTSGSSVSLTPIAATVYSITGTGSNGCISPVGTAPTVTISTLAAPVIAVSGPTAICMGQSATLTASGANTYSWNPTPIANSLVVSPSSTTVYTVSGTGTNVCNGITTRTLVVNPLPVINVTPASPTVCSMETVNFTASGASTYTWNGTTTGASIGLLTPASTVYSVTGTSAAGCINTRTVAVTTNSLPVVTISPASPTTCAHEFISFTGSGAVTYTWNGSMTGSNVAIFNTTTTTHTVVGTSPDGCTSSATVPVLVHQLPVLVPSPAYTTVCSLSRVILDVSGATTYTWNNTTFSHSIEVNPASTIAYTVTGTDNNGCETTITVPVITNTLPPVQSIPAAATVCANSPVIFAASGAASYTLNGTAFTNTASFSPTATTVYTLQGTDPNNGCIGTNTVMVTTNPTPVLTITKSSDDLCKGAQMSLTVTGASLYSWSDGQFGGAINVAPNTTTSYTVTGTDVLGCKSSVTTAIVVHELPVVSISPAAATLCAGEVVSLSASGANSYNWAPGNLSGASVTISPTSNALYIVTGTDANNCSATANYQVKVSACVGLAENFGSKTRLFPNPSNGVFNVEFGFNGNKTVTVINNLGQVIVEKNVNSDATSIDLSSYHRGVYFVRVTQGSSTAVYRVITE